MKQYWSNDSRFSSPSFTVSHPTFGDVAKHILENVKHPFDIDGLIIQSLDHSYDTLPMKWKPVEQSTIDFIIQYLGNGKIRWFSMGKSTNVKQELLAKNTFSFVSGLQEKSPIPILFEKSPESIVTVSPTDLFYTGNIEHPSIQLTTGLIIEAQWNFNTQQFEPYRIRDDKMKSMLQRINEFAMFMGPNSLITALDVWANIHSPLTTDILYNIGSKSTIKTKSRIKSPHINNIFINNDSGFLSHIFDIYTRVINTSLNHIEFYPRNANSIVELINNHHILPAF